MLGNLPSSAATAPAADKLRMTVVVLALSTMRYACGGSGKGPQDLLSLWQEQQTTIVFHSALSSSCIGMPKSIRTLVASAGSSPHCTSSTNVTSTLCGRKEQELSKARITNATFISLLPLMCSQVSSLLVTVGPNFTCQTAPAPTHFKFCGGSSPQKNP